MRSRAAVTMLGRHCVRHASNVQFTIALSCGEFDTAWCEVVRQDLGCHAIVVSK